MYTIARFLPRDLAIRSGWPAAFAAQPTLYGHGRWTSNAAEAVQQPQESKSLSTEELKSLEQSSAVAAGLHRESFAQSQGAVVRRVQARIRRFKRVELKAVSTRQKLTPKHIELKEWRTTYQLLLDHTSTNPSAFRKEVKIFRVVPRDGGPLTNDIKQFFLTINLQTLITASRVPEPFDQSFCICFYGYPDQISAATRMVMKHCTSFEEVAEAEADMITREQQSKSVRSTLTISGRHRSAAEAKAIDEIATPNTMTIISFANYVNSLTIARPSRLKLRHGSTWGHSVNNFGDHIERVANILVALFKTKKLRPCWSSTAAIRTLQFLGKHRMFPKSRELLLELSKVKYYRQFRTYEGFLEATSVAYDLKNFQYGVEVMIRQGIAPSPRIWAQFLRIVAKYDYSAGQIVLKAMRSHHLLESPAARIEALEQVALPEYEMWIDRSGSFATFLNYLRREWQLEYISESVIGRLLPYHLHRAQWKEAETLMHHAMSRGRFVESSHLSMCLKNAARHGDPEAAVRFCKLCLPFSSMDREGFRELFSLVWHRQYLCMLNVVWRFGCLHGHISYEMESLMRGSLLRAPNASDDLSTVTSKTDSELAAPAPVPGTFHLSLLKDLVSSASLRHGIFERIAAVNAIGLGLGVVDGKRTMQVGSKIPAYMTKQERLKIMEQDMATGRQYHAQIPFEDILEEAYQRDLEMKRGGLPNNLPAITAMCPQVPVIERSDTMSSIGADDKARSADFYSSVSEALKEPKDKQAKK